MARVIMLWNAKGGVGKTTSAINLASYLAISGKKVLLIDFDPQANATLGLGISHEPEETVYHAMFGGQDTERVLKSTHFTNLHVVPSSADLAGALVELVSVEGREEYLRKFVDSLRDRYDFIFIDLGPSLNLLTINGFFAADEVIVPIQCEYYSLQGVEQLLDTIRMVRENLGHHLKVAGALLTMHEAGARFSEDVVREIRENFPHHVYDVIVPRSAPLAEAPGRKRPVVLYAPQSPGAEAYERLAEEVLRQGLSTD